MTTSSLRARLLVTTLAIATSAPALAQPSPPETPTPLPATDPQAVAKAHYVKGNNHYNLGEFDQAIIEFKAAYSLTSAPGLLFNIAQSFRLLKNYEQALLFYRNYLRLKPDAGNRADVDMRIEEMEKFIAEQKASALSPPRGTVPPEGDITKPATDPTATVTVIKPEVQPSVAPRLDDGEASSGRTLQTAGLATAGAGVALVITGLVFGSMASSAEDELNALSPNMGVWTTAQQETYDSGKRNNTIAIVSLVAGGAAIATGGALWYLGRTKVKNSTVAVMPTRTGATFAVGWAF